MKDQFKRRTPTPTFKQSTLNFLKVLMVASMLIPPMLSFTSKSVIPVFRYSKQEGFPTNTVYCMKADRYGVLWLGTDVGLLMFDGFKIKTFNIDHGLASNDIFEIFCDAENRIWLTSFKPAIQYVKNGKIYSSTNDSILARIKGQGNLPRFFQDKDSNIWVRSNPFALSVINKNGTVENFGEAYGVSQVTEVGDKLYFFSNFFSWKYDKKSALFQKITPKAGRLVNGLAALKDGLLIINEQGRLEWIRRESIDSGRVFSASMNWEIPVFDTMVWLPNPKGFSVFSINNIRRKLFNVDAFPFTYVHEDISKNFWVATLNNGFFKLGNLSVRNQLRERSLTSVAYYNEKIICGTSQGEVIVTDNNSELSDNVINFESGYITSTKILRISKGLQSSFLITTDRGAYKYYLNRQIIERIPVHHNALKYFASNDDSLIVLDNDGVRFYNRWSYLPIDSLFNHKRHYSYIEYNGKKIVGSQDSLFYIKDRKFIPYPLDKHFDYRAVDLQVKDSLLVATTAEGGVFFIERNKIVRNLNVANGFRTNTCYRSVLYNQQLFTATNLGVHVYDFSNDSLYYFFESDGLPSNNVFDLCVYNDTLYAATEGGLSVIPLSAIPRKRGFPFFINPVIISKDSLWDRTDSFDLHTDDDITFVANGLSFGTRNPVRYFYRIPAIDTAFRETTDPNVSFRSLPLGITCFEIYAMNGEGTRTPLITLRINVVPYFYQTNAFKFMLLFISLAGVGAAVYFSVRRAKRIERERAALHRRLWILELDKWRSAVNPHFLFNSLNTVQALFKKNQFNLANDFIGSFSILLRRTIDQSGHLLVKVSEESKFLKSYLEVEQRKTAEPFEFTLEIDHANLNGYFIPSLVIQPVIENSLKHGIRNMSGGQIKLEMYREGEHILCLITDNGQGFQQQDGRFREGSQGIGLIHNKLDAIRSLLNVQLDFSYHNLTNADGKVIGTKSVFIFPFITQNYDLPNHTH